MLERAGFRDVVFPNLMESGVPELRSLDDHHLNVSFAVEARKPGNGTFDNACMGLAVSNFCGGRCLFCPRTRGRRLPQTMPLGLAKRIIDDAVGVGIKRFSVGDNGDALMCPDFVEILRYIKAKGRDNHVSLVTNFQLLIPDISRIILGEDLVDVVVVNIDGGTARSYERSKGLNYETMCDNVEAFLRIRDGTVSQARLRIDCVTYFHYRTCVQNAFGRLPEYLKDDLPDDFDLIQRTWLPKLRDGDSLNRSTPYAWALRELCTKDPRQFGCWFLDSIERMTSINIAPNGDWYPCCFMDDQTVVLGNLGEKTIMEVVSSEERRLFIERLKNRNYHLIGYPCTKVEACRYIGIGKEGP
jgi:radical SAM protein with 4Fe4S-binding SPASM domain